MVLFFNIMSLARMMFDRVALSVSLFEDSSCLARETGLLFFGL